jgi:Ferredoxin thioredoxin reductase variable alpha chain
MQVGDRVRVVTSVVVYHHPQHKKQAFDLKGTEGAILKVLEDWHGRPISPNLPIVVQFENRFQAHFRAEEIEII